jgi:hypothetical protein
MSSFFVPIVNNIFGGLWVVGFQLSVVGCGLRSISASLTFYSFLYNSIAIIIKPTPVRTGGAIFAFIPSAIITMATRIRIVKSSFFIIDLLLKLVLLFVMSYGLSVVGYWLWGLWGAFVYSSQQELLSLFAFSKHSFPSLNAKYESPSVPILSMYGIPNSS